MCNPLFKFRILTEWADRLGCAFVATGHYTRLEERNGKTYIVAGDDDKKDQSYFLWRLGQEVLKRCIFPLGRSPRCRSAGIFVIKDIRSRRKKGKYGSLLHQGRLPRLLARALSEIDSEVGKDGLSIRKASSWAGTKDSLTTPSGRGRGWRLLWANLPTC